MRGWLRRLSGRLARGTMYSVITHDLRVWANVVAVLVMSCGGKDDAADACDDRGCALACVDEDGDGYGVGCDTGPDCDDQRADRWADCPPFRINPAHPRLYVDAARVDEIRRAAVAGVPLNGDQFPSDSGRLRFDLYPIRLPSPDLEGIFDRYDASRNHLFIRHLADTTTAAELGIQVALQPTGAPYVAALNFALPYDRWHALSVAWNSTEHTATVTVNGIETALIWQLDDAGQPREWQANDQQFVMRGPHGIDNVRLFDSDSMAGAATLVSYEMNEVAGGRVVDSSGNGHDALLSQSAAAGPRSSSDPDAALWLEPTSVLRIAADSALTESWIDTYAAAGGHARRLLEGTHSIDLVDDHPGGIIGISRSMGVAYLVTGESRFREAAWVYADMLLGTAATEGNDYTTSGRAEAMGLLYDWFFEDMLRTAAPGGATYAELLRIGILAIVRHYERYICGNTNPLSVTGRCTEEAHPDFVSGHAHQNDTEMMAALMAIADESPEAENILRDMHDIFVRGFNPAREWISVDGGHHMGWSYGATYTFLDSILLWQETAGVPMEAPWQGQRIYPYIYGLRSDNRFPASGDGTFAKPASQILAAFALWGAARFDDPYARTYYEQWVRPVAGGIRDRELFFLVDGVEGAPFTDLPLARHFGNAGQVVMRESWDFAESSVVEFKSTSFSTQNHHHRDQNAFTVFSRAPLLVDSGDYDSYGTYHWHNYYTRTIAHNTVTVWDPDEEFRSGGNLATNDGGQLIPQNGQLPTLREGGAWHLDGITNFTDGGEYSYAVGNASKAYSGDKLDQARGYVRSMVFLRAPSFWSRPVIVIFDEVNATPTGGGLAKRFLLHTVNEPEPLGGVSLGPGQYAMPRGPMRIRNGGGMVLVETLLPMNPVVHKIGGHAGGLDYRFMVPDAVTGELINIPPSPEPSETPPDLGAWRLEISSPTPTEHERFLHVLSIADDDPVLAPPSTQLLASTGGVACFLGDTLVVGFRENGPDAPQLTVRVPAATFRLLAFGFAPGGRYAAETVPVTAGGPVDVSLHAREDGDIVASAEGVIELTVP